tara:strand:- start:313 stop:573 length:261 start_codon:yes stop_codon:yes gene_type:complete
MFDWVYRLLGYELKKDERKKYVDKKIQEEIEDAIFKKKCLETPSFSKCVIPNRIEKSQKQQDQMKSYRDAVRPPTPPRTRSKSIAL